MAGDTAGTMSINVPITVAVPIDLIIRVKDDEPLSPSAMKSLLPQISTEITKAIKKLPNNITPLNTKSPIAPSTVAKPFNIAVADSQFFHSDNWNDHYFSVTTSTKVWTLKEEIAERDGTAPERLSLFFKGEEMENKRTLGEVSILC